MYNIPKRINNKHGQCTLALVMSSAREGLQSLSHLRGVIPLVTLTNFSGVIS